MPMQVGDNVPYGGNSGVFNYQRTTVTATLECNGCGEQHEQTHSLKQLWNINLDEVVDDNCPGCGIGTCTIIKTKEK